MNNSEMLWYNKVLFNYIQKTPFTTFSAMISTKTQDFQNFCPITFDLFISPKEMKSKVYKLDYINSYDFLQTVLDIRTTGNPFEINACFSKRYNKNKNLEIKYIINSNNEEVVDIIIRCGELDYNQIILPKSVFYSTCNLIKEFNTNYIKISTKIQNEWVQLENLKELKSNNILIKNLPSKLIEINYDQYISKKLEDNKEISKKEINLDNSKEISQIDSNTILSSKNLEDFDKFIGGNNISNIELKEIDELNKEIPKENEHKEININFKSELISKVLNNDISNFENLMYSIYQDSDPLENILTKLKSKMNLSSDFHFLSGIELKDFKSIKYISNVLLKTNLKNYLINGTDFPDNSPIIKYRCNSDSYFFDNENIAYDLLLIVIFIKILNSKLSSSITDPYDNKKSLYIMSRLILDPLIFSFLNNIDNNIVINEIMLRYKCYNENNFFNEYYDLLSTYNLSFVDEDKFKDITTKIIEISKKSPYIKELHNTNYNAGKLKIPSENTLNVEQITNEVVDLEVNSSLNPILKIEEIIKNEDLNVSEEVVKLFKSNKSTRKTNDYGTNLLRYINFYKSEISEVIKNDFINYISELEFNNFDYEKFSLDELSENIVKGIYIWNSSENKEEKYTKFFAECENTISKDLIISKIKGTKDLVTDNVPWFENL